MNKKCMLKIGAIGIMVVLILIGLTSLSLMVITSANENQIYNLGEKITIDIGDIGEYLLKIQTPEQTFVHKSDKSYFIFQPEIVGKYYISIKSVNNLREIIFIVEEKIDETLAPKINNIYLPLEEINTEQVPQSENFTQEEPADSQQIIVGKPVKWKKEIKSSSEKISLKIPKSSTDIKIEGNPEIQFKVKNSLIDSVSNLLSEEKQKSLLITNIKENIEIEYTTPAPEKTEKIISATKKEVKVSSEVHYENVIAFSEINEITKDKDDIHIYWVEEKIYLDFKTEDSDSDGLIDNVVWNIPHLSDQTFQIIIDIIDAEHLDENRNFIKNIYPELAEQDNIWIKIPDKNYARVTFQKELNFWNDITVYARGEGKIEVYEKDGIEKIADFGEISSEGTYKIFLTGLSAPQDTFDLKIIGEIELDYVIDPYSVASCTAIIACIDNGGAGSCTCAQVDSSDDVYLGSGLDSKSGNLAQGVINLSNSSLIPASATVTDAELSLEYGLESGFDVCTIQYSKNAGTSWISLDADCTDDTTESVHAYDMSSLTESELESMAVNFTAWKTAGQGAPLSLNIDHVFLNVSYAIQGALSVLLNLPTNGNNVSSPTVQFGYYPLSTGNFVNCSLWDNSSGSFAYSTLNTSTVTNGTTNYINKTYSSDGKYLWNVLCCDDDPSNNCTFAPVNYTFTLDTNAPTISLIDPANNNFTDSNQGVNFTYSVTDTSQIKNCSLVIDNQKVYIDTTITKDTTQNFEYFLSNGLHNWTVNCSDFAGNENTTTQRAINVSVPSTDWQKRWYETSTSSYTSTANIFLSNTRDGTENNVAMSIGSASYETLVDATSPYIGGDGAFLTEGTVSISGVFSTSRQNQEYITWKIYITNSTGDTLICQYGNDNTGGIKLSLTATTTYGTSCNNPSDLSLQGTDRIRLVINAYNAFGSAVTVTNYWDYPRLSFIEFADFYSLGIMEVNMTYPTEDLEILSTDSFNISCEVSCIGGRCLNTNVYAQYNTSSTDWTNIGVSGNLILAGGETNPHSFGSVNSTIQITNFTIDANIDSVNNIRCIAESDYSDKNGTAIKEVIISAANEAPSVNLTSPPDNNWFDTNNVNLYYNATDDNNQIANCSLYLNGVFNQTNQTIINETGTNNFTLTGLTDGQYNWTINCTDQSELVGTSGARTFYVDTIFPQIDLVFPGIAQTIYQSDVNFNFSVSDNLKNPIVCNLTVDGDVKDQEFDAVNGTYTNRTISLGIGDHYWNVTCWDDADNTNTSETRNFTIIDLPPTVNLSTSDNNWFDTSNPVLEYLASDNNQIANCSLYLNGAFNQTNQTIVNEAGTNNFTLTGLADGEYNWTVNCTDNTGLTSQPTERNFYVDTTAPTINLNLPGDTSTSLSSDINFNFTSTENLGAIRCNLTINGQDEDTNFSASNGSLTNRLLTGLTDGLKYWNVTCWDDASNTNTSATRTVNVTEYPSVIQDTIDEESFNTTNIALYYTPSDNTNLSSCSLYINGAFNQTNQTTVDNGAQNNFTLTLGSGYYNWSVSCTDLIGLTNSTQNRSLIVDLAKPTISLFSPAPGADIYDSVIDFNYSVDDDLDANLDCNLTINGIVENQTVAIDEAYTIIPITFTEGGLKYWNVTCWDDAGNTNTSETRNITVYLPPTVILTSPNESEWLNSSDINFYYNVSDGNDDIIGATLILNGELNQTNQTVVINNQENNFTLTDLTDGQYSWTVNVSDAEGMTGTASPRIFYIDTETPNITILSPAQDEVITTNNITFNFTVEDNLATNLTCNLTIGLPGDPPEIENFNVQNGSIETNYITRGDGNYSWYVECLDEANNYNVTNLVNFSVVAPPTVNLTAPFPSWRTNLTTINFEYTPYDGIGITNCDLYIDGVFNDTDSDIEKNVPNYFNGKVLNEGEHNWSIECLDADLNANAPSTNIFYIDMTPPAIQLNSPGNDTGIDANNANVVFNWTPTDALDTLITCDLVVDGIVEENDVLATSGFPVVKSVSGLYIGEHIWNVTCWDRLNNINTSETRTFNRTYPDFFVNESGINFSTTSPTEEESTTINATVYNLGGVNISSVEIEFYEGNPQTTGIKIGSTQDISIDAFGSTTASVNWDATIGGAEIFVVSDPTNSFTELSELNNNASKNISVSSWHFFYGDIESDSESRLADSTASRIIRWDESNLTNANIYVTDYNSEINWISLQAIGKTTSGLNSSDDIIKIDSILGMTSFGDSLESIYMNGSEINETKTFLVFKNYILNVPISNSINNSNFKTGILWDTSDDTTGEYDSTEKEDIIFITSVNTNTVGTYGITDYELRVPAKLREYDSVDQTSAVFYVEII